MTVRARTAIAGATAAAVAAAVVIVVADGSGGSPSAEFGRAERPLSMPDREPRRGRDDDSARQTPAATVRVPGTHPRGARMDCSTRAEAEFPGAFTDPRNLVVGPLVIVGGAAVARDQVSVIRRYHGQKLPVLVKAGHTVTLRVARRARRFAGLGYTPEGRVLTTQVGLRDTHHAVTFTACRRGEPSGSHAGGEAVTFWSGAMVVTRAPACLPLEVYLDDEPSPRRLVLSLAAGRCGEPAEARPPAAVATPPLRDCRSRAEGDRPPEATSRPGDVVVGPLAFAGLEDEASRRGLEPYRVGRVYLVKSGLLLRAGTRVTLAIAHPARAWVSLAYATRRVRDVADGDLAVRFQACPHDEPAFSYDGPVGIVTGFAGGFILSRRGCVPLEVRVAGHWPVRARIPLGVDRCRGRN